MREARNINTHTDKETTTVPESLLSRVFYFTQFSPGSRGDPSVPFFVCFLAIVVFLGARAYTIKTVASVINH